MSDPKSDLERAIAAARGVPLAAIQQATMDGIPKPFSRLSMLLVFWQRCRAFRHRKRKALPQAA
ncbi:MAG: hypothetical protein U1F68_02330 [Gammaproteobacteria bacterium]